MNIIERDIKAYKLAEHFLLSLGIAGITEALLDKYRRLPEHIPRPDTVEGIYLRLLESAQNANMKSGVIGGSLGGVDKLSIVLFNFNPRLVVENYSDRCDNLLDSIATTLKPRGQLRRTPKSIWPRYCQTVLSAAIFMAQFSTAVSFYELADMFDRDERVRVALPLLLSAEVYGIGFPLACDFLKELGYLNYAKPDVHIKDIFTALQLCPMKASDFEVFKSVVRVAKNVGVTPYAVDKLFWLIGSGKFYDDMQIGVNGRTGSHKKRFIDYVISCGL
jgi:thermostable 8-oxoguanine DNA glycosylase